MFIMKRIRGEHIQSAAGSYLKRRHYSDTLDSSSKKENKLTSLCSLGQMALHGSVVHEGSITNTISYSGISGDATAYDQQFNKFKKFIGESIEPFRTELQELAYPVFVHAYLELLCNGQKTPAHKFYHRHHTSALTREEHSPILEALKDMFTKEDVLGDKQVTSFRESKYKVCLSSSAIEYLFRYLKSEANVLMLQIFNQHIDLKVEAVASREEVAHLEDKFAHPNALVSPEVTPENKVIRNDMSLNTLQQCIKKVRDGPPPVNSVCFYTFLNSHQGQCCGTLSRDETMLCGGYEDSSVRVWSLQPKPLHNLEKTDVDISRVNLGGDFIEDVKLKSRVCEESETVTLRGHSGSVYSANFTKDNRFIISGSEDTTVRLWDMKTHTNRVIYRGHSYPVWGIDTSNASDSFFVSCSQDRSAKLWCLDRTFPVRTFLGHTQDVDCVKFHPNGSYIATGSGDKTVRLWSVEDGKPVRLFQGHRGAIMAVAFSPNGQYLASAGEDRRVKIWDLTNGSLLKDLRGHLDTVHSLAFNKDNTVIASGGIDCMLKVWDIRKTQSSAHTTIESNASHELLGTFPTKSTTIHHLQYTKRNLLVGVGSITS